MRGLMERAAACIGVAAASCAFITGSAVAGTVQPALHNTYAPNCNELVYKPSDIIITCADANIAMENAHWHTWTLTSATGTADYVVNDCIPNCAEGHFHRYRANVELYLVRPGTYRNWFSRIHFQFPFGGPGGKPATTYGIALLS